MGDRFQVKKPQSDHGKRIKVADTKGGNSFNLPPKFCLRAMRSGYSVKECTKEQQAAFAERLYELSRLTWAQIYQAPRMGQGFEKLSRDAITDDKVPSDISEDVNFIASRCIGKASMVGYRSGDGVFNIIWIDRAFTLYDHGS